MSPPIYTPDGSEVSEIVLPDGSTASQVIDPDGNVVFEAGADIPDSGDLHSWYKFDELSSSTTSNVPDSSGNGHDLVNGSFTGVSTTINGVQAGEFDGNNDGINSNTFSSISQPFTVFAVAELSGTGTGDRDRIVTLNSSTVGVIGWDRPDQRWDLFFGTELQGSSNTNVKLITFVVDGANGVIRETGGQTASGDVGLVNMDVVSVGFKVDSNDEFWEGAIGEVAIYPDRRSASQIAQVESYLANKWDITI